MMDQHSSQWPFRYTEACLWGCVYVCARMHAGLCVEGTASLIKAVRAKLLEGRVTSYIMLAFLCTVVKWGIFCPTPFSLHMWAHSLTHSHTHQTDSSILVGIVINTFSCLSLVSHMANPKTLLQPKLKHNTDSEINFTFLFTECHPRALNATTQSNTAGFTEIQTKCTLPPAPWHTGQGNIRHQEIPALLKELQSVVEGWRGGVSHNLPT